MYKSVQLLVFACISILDYVIKKESVQIATLNNFADS